MYNPYQILNDNSSYGCYFNIDNITTTGYNVPTHSSTTK